MQQQQRGRRQLVIGRARGLRAVRHRGQVRTIQHRVLHPPVIDCRRVQPCRSDFDAHARLQRRHGLPVLQQQLGRRSEGTIRQQRRRRLAAQRHLEQTVVSRRAERGGKLVQALVAQLRQHGAQRVVCNDELLPITERLPVPFQLGEQLLRSDVDARPVEARALCSLQSKSKGESDCQASSKSTSSSMSSEEAAAHTVCPS